MQNQSKKVPGVGRYEIVPKNEKVIADKVVGNYTYNELVGGFTDTAVYYGQATPPHYDAVDLDKIKNRVTSTKITAFKGDKDAQYKFVKDNSPSPHTY